jgi:hypothetical protein
MLRFADRLIPASRWANDSIELIDEPSMLAVPHLHLVIFHKYN